MIEFAELLMKCEQLLWLLMETWSSGQFSPISQDERECVVCVLLCMDTSGLIQNKLNGMERRICIVLTQGLTQVLCFHCMFTINSNMIQAYTVVLCPYCLHYVL